MRADARGSADVIYCMWRISLLCGSDIVNDVTKVGHAHNIYYQRIVLSCLIHTLTLRRNVISLAIFNAIFWKIGGGLLVWATLYIYINISHKSLSERYSPKWLQSRHQPLERVICTARKHLQCSGDHVIQTFPIPVVFPTPVRVVGSVVFLCIYRCRSVWRTFQHRCWSVPKAPVPICFAS